ncbi:endolytic transglycosylase MltG, partial [Vibrio parahaemolyticus]
GLRLVDPGPLPAARVVVVSRGGGLETVAHELAAAGVIDTPWLFMAAARLPPGRALQAGEFAFPAHVSLLDAIDILRNGKPVVHKLSVP